MNLLGKFLIFITTIIWGSSFFILKNTIDILPPLFVVAIRFTISALVLGIIFVKKLRKINKTILWKGALLGLMLSFAFIIQTIGLKHTTPSKNAFLTATYCVIVPFLAWKMMKKKPSIFNVVASFLSLIGIGFISLNSHFVMGIGDLLTVISSLFFALQLVMIAKYIKDEDSMLLLVVELVVCAIICWTASLSFELPNYPTTIPSGAIISILYLSLMATGLGQTFQMIGQRYTKPSEAGLIFSLEAVFGTIFSVIFYHEIITINMYIGFCLVFVALVISETQLKGLIKCAKKVKVKMKL